MLNSQVAQADKTLSIPGCKLTSKGAIFDKTLSFEEWQAIGGTLRYLEKSVLFWIGDWINYGETKFGEKYAQALDSTGYEYGTLRNAAWVCDNVPLSSRDDNLGFKHHAAVAPLPPEDQKSWLAEATEKDLGYRELREKIQKQKVSKKLALPTDKYRVFYADPPWCYGDKLAGFGGAEDHYPSMSIEEICNLKICSIASDDAVLFMWVTSPLLDECWPIIKAWGFEYKTSIVWNKDAHNFGHYVSVQHELLLICTKGSCVPEISELLPSVITEKRTGRHSEKPECFRELIDKLYPSGKRIEIFSRNKVKGWDSYGNEV